MTAIRDEKIILVIEKSMLIVWEVHVAGGHWDGAFRQIHSGSLGTIGRVGTEMDTSVVISHVLFNKAPAPPKSPRSSHPAERTHISIVCVCVCVISSLVLNPRSQQRPLVSQSAFTDHVFPPS